MKAQIDILETTVSKSILNLKELKDQVAEADQEARNIEDQLAKLTRAGRQPLNKSQKGQRNSIKKPNYRRDPYDDYSDDDDRGSYDIPELEGCTGNYEMEMQKDHRKSDHDEALMSMSPQTRDTILEQERAITEKKLSVIMDDNESQYFEESEYESMYGD